MLSAARDIVTARPALAEVPGTIQSAAELHHRVAQIPTVDRYLFLARHFGAVASSRSNQITTGRIHGPWTHGVDHARVAAQHLGVLRSAYSSGHYALDYGVDGVKAYLDSGRYMIWNLVGHGQDGTDALATAGLFLRNAGLAEMCCAAVAPGNNGVGSAVQFGRLADFFQRASDHQGHKVWGLESELLTRGAYSSVGGQLSPSSEATQHLNRFLAALLVFTVVAYPEGDGFVGEPQFDSRLYLQPERINRGVLYTPLYNPKQQEAPSQAEIARSTYPLGLGFAPKFSPLSSRPGPQSIQRLDFAPPRVVYKISGQWTRETLAHAMENEFRDLPLVEFAVPNEPGNYELQVLLYQMGFLASGVRPGGTFDVQGYTVNEPDLMHFMRPKEGVQLRTIPVSLASDYKGTGIQDVTTRAQKAWLSAYPG